MGVFETSDGHMNIAGGGQVIWQRLCEALDVTTLLIDPDYAEPEARSANRDALNNLLEEKTREQTTAYWVEFLNSKSVPCGEINAIDQVFENPQIKHLGMAQKVTSTERGEIELVGQPIDMSRTPSALAMPPPTCGEHSDEVLEELGYSAAEISQLRAEDII